MEYSDNHNNNKPEWNENGYTLYNNTRTTRYNNRRNNAPPPPNNDNRRNTLLAPVNNNNENENPPQVIVAPKRYNNIKTRKQTKLNKYFTRKPKTYNIRKLKKLARKFGNPRTPRTAEAFERWGKLGSKRPEKPERDPLKARRLSLIRNKEAAAEAAEALALSGLQAEAEERAARRRGEDN